LAQQGLSHSVLGKILKKSKWPVGIGGVLASTMMASTGDPDSKKAKWAPAVGLTSVAPSLVDEGVSSLRAMKALRQLGASSQELSHARSQLGKSFGSNALKWALPAVLAPVLMRQTRKFHRNRRDKLGLPREEDVGK